MKEGALGLPLQGSPRKSVNLDALIKQIDVLLNKNRNQSYKGIQTGELVYIISEKQLKQLQQDLKNNRTSIPNQLKIINSNIIDDIETSAYTYYDHHLRPEITEENQDPEWKIRFLTRKIYDLILKEVPNVDWKKLQRKIIKQKGQKQIDLNPYRVDIEIITAKQIKSTHIQCTNSQRSFTDVLNFKKIRINFYHNETINHLLYRIRNLLFNDKTQLRIYEYDSTLFKVFSFHRMIQYCLKKQNSRFAVNQDQLHFYKLQDKENELNDSDLLEFFPGKLLLNQTVDQIKGNRPLKLILQVRDEDWVFPSQPNFSVAKCCKFCMIKMQLYIRFNCSNCQNDYLFCSKICHYQFLMQHSCEQSKTEIASQYGPDYLNPDKAQNTSFEQSALEIDKRNVIQVIKADPKSVILSKGGKFDLKNNQAVDSLGGGMNNLGNACYLNASLQTLIRTSLTTVLTKMQKQIMTSRIKYKLTKAYLKLIKKMGQLAEHQSLEFDDMESFKTAVDNNLEQFQGYYQHDAHQFIMFFLDKLSQQLNTNANIARSIKIQNIRERQQDEDLAKRQWLTFISKNNSPIINLFFGQIKSEINCPHCHTIYRKFDSFSILSLSIPEQNQVLTIDLTFETHLFKEKIKYVRLELIGNTVEDIIKNVVIRLGLSEQKSELVKAYLLGYEGPCPEISKKKKISELMAEMNAFGERQNQLFLFQMPSKTAEMLLFKFTYESNALTFKKPIFFNEVKAKIRNFRLYGMISEYLLNMASHYITPKSQIDELKKKMIINPRNYFKIRIISILANNQKSETQIQPNTQIQKQLFQKCEIEVCIQKFDKLSQKDAVFFNTIIKKLNKFVKASEPKTKINQDIKQIPQHLEDCLREEFNKKQLLANGNEWHCQTCNQKRRVHQITHLYKTNKYLFIQIKRFKRGSDGEFYKNTNKVVPPLELNLQDILNNSTLPETYYKNLTDQQLDTYHLPKDINTAECKKYNLIGLILHEGKLGSGHYTALFKNQKWLNYNDSIVSEINIQKTLKNANTMQKIYILLYERSK